MFVSTTAKKGPKNAFLVCECVIYVAFWIPSIKRNKFVHEKYQQQQQQQQWNLRNWINFFLMYKQKPPMRILKSVRHLPSTHTHTRTREKKKTTNVMNKESRNWAFVERKNSLPDNFNVKSIFSTLLIMYEMHTNIFLSCEYSNCWISRVYLCLLTSVRVCLFFFVSVCPCQVYL